MRGVSSNTFFIVILLTIVTLVVYNRTSTQDTATKPAQIHQSRNPDNTATMPLVDSLTMKPQDKNEEWQNKLVGKKLGDEASSETVRPPYPLSSDSKDDTRGDN